MRWLHLKTSINFWHTFEWVQRTCTDSHYCARYVLLFTQALDSHKVFIQVTVKYKVNKVHQSTNKLVPISLVTAFHLLTWWFWSCFILFAFQGYPASLRLLVHAEGEKLTLLLEKNEWVFAWFIYPSSADSVNVYVNDGQQINGPQLRLDGVVYPGCVRLWSCVGPGLWYSVFKEGENNMSLSDWTLLCFTLSEGSRDESW